jgi:tripartite-type tricarboxylate transporter receptor subunit TctC
VPFKGTGPALTALLSNEITFYMSTFASALPHVKAERLRPYAVTTTYRAGPLPDVPTLAESGFKDFEYAVAAEKKKWASVVQRAKIQPI